ncbi:MAG: hypothetical protein ACU843_07770 [Gammaproteobacteria bacterium]
MNRKQLSEDQNSHDAYAYYHRDIKLLQESFDARLDPSRRKGRRNISRANKKLAETALLFFDYQNAPALLSEHKNLSAGSGNISDAAVPAIFERTVIREALYNLNALKFVNSDVAKFDGAIEIPYSYRDTTAAGRENTRSYEGQEINLAGIAQSLDLAYPVPLKIAFQVSDELVNLGKTSILQWEAIEENSNNIARIIAEDTDRLIYNEMLLASDEFGATAVVDENPGSQADGTKRVLLLNNFPVVRPRTTFDLSGNPVGPTKNPISVSYNGTPIAEYDGTGAQDSGAYYVLNYNLGEIYLTNETGAIQTPGSGVPWAVSYSYATDVYNFDSDPGSDEVADHWDQFLYRYALRIGAIQDQRYYRAEFGLMSGTAMTQIEQAK